MTPPTPDQLKRSQSPFVRVSPSDSLACPVRSMQVCVAIPFRSGLTFRLKALPIYHDPLDTRRNPLSFGSHLPTGWFVLSAAGSGIKSQSPFVRVSPSDGRLIESPLRSSPQVAIPFRSGLTFRPGARPPLGDSLSLQSQSPFVRVSPSDLSNATAMILSRIRRNPLSFGSHLPTRGDTAKRPLSQASQSPFVRVSPSDLLGS